MMGPETTTGQASSAFGDRAGRRGEDRIVGASAATQQVVERARAAAATQLPVWIVGPPGSGKELVARAIHAWGSRRTGPFAAFSCGSIPEGLHARELFGCAANVHAQLPVAYSGQLRGAAGGSLLVDRVEALRDDLRSVLLRAIERRSFRGEGEQQDRPLEARLLLGTETASASSWLGDLPHHEIRLLPLKERAEDILPLAAHFLASFAAEAGVTPVGFTPEARTWLVAEPWPNNVRELRERIRQAVRLAGSGAVSAEALMLSGDGESVPSFKEAKRAFETRYVIGLLRRCNGNISRAARLAKKDRKDFYDVIRRTNVDPSQFRT